MGKMKPYAKLALMQNARQEGNRGAESRFRDRRGREHYDNGRFAPMRNDTNIEIEGRFRDDRGRERFEDGSFAPMNRGGSMGYGNMNEGDSMEMRRGGGRGGSGSRSEMEMGYGGMEEMESRSRRDSRGRFRSEMGGMDGERMGYGNMGGEMEMEGGYGHNHYPYRPFGPFPVYRGAGMRSGGGEMRQIGFDPYREIETNYPMNAGYEMRNEMAYQKGSRMEGGHAMGMSEEEEIKPMTREMAEKWVQGMKGANGSKGQHWNMDQAKQIMSRYGYQADPVEFYVTLNMMKSDYTKAAQKMGVDKEEFYAAMADAFLNDEDAKDHKLVRYCRAVVKHEQ